MQLFVLTVLEKEAVRKDTFLLTFHISKLSSKIKQPIICELVLPVISYLIDYVTLVELLINI